MSWTAPRTWVTGELVTSTMLNTHLRDDLSYLFGLTGAGEEIADSGLLVASTTSISLTSLPQTYRHLLVICSLRGTGTTGALNFSARFNSDSGANYGDTTAVSGLTSILIGRASYVATDPQHSAAVFVVPSYADATYRKTLAGFRGGYVSTDGAVVTAFTAGRWFAAAAAITSLQIVPAANSIDVGSRVSVYGF